MNCVYCLLIYLLVAVPVALLFARWLEMVSKYYPEVKEWEPRD
jgi:hypothetical protein